MKTIPSMSINKILLEYSHTFIYVLSMATFAQFNSWVFVTEAIQSQKFILSGTLQKNLPMSALEH